MPRCPRGPLARFRVSPSVSDSPPVLRPLAVPVRSARLSMAASQTAAVHESLLACLTRGPTVVDIFKGARGTLVARDQRQSRASKGRWRTCGAWLRAGSRFLRSPVCQRGGGHRRTALRRGQEAGGPGVPGKSGEKRSKSAGKIGAGCDATRGRTDGRGPRPERIDWRDPPGARPVSLHLRRTSLLHAALCGCGGNSWLVVVGRATPCGHDIPLRNVASLPACLPAARSQDLGLRRLPANAEPASTTLI